MVINPPIHAQFIFPLCLSIEPVAYVVSNQLFTSLTREILNHEIGPMNQKIGYVSISFSFLSPYPVQCIQEMEGESKSPTFQRLGSRQSAHASSPVLIFSFHIRFDILDQEMKTLMTQIDGVNLAANSLVDSGHPRSGEVKQYQDHLNARWGVDWAGD